MGAKKDPFDDDDDEEIPKIEETDDDEEAPAKEVSTEPDPNDEDEEEGGKKPGQWAAKKQNRFKEAQEAAERERQRVTELERQLNEERARTIATEQTARMYMEHQQRSAAGQQQDPWQAALDDVASKRKAIILEANSLRQENKWDAAQQDRLQGEWQKTEVRQQEIITDKRLYYERAQAQQAAPQVEARAKAAAVEEQIKMRYPDIFTNPAAVAYMNHTFMRAISAERKPNDWNTADQVAAETRRAFKLGNPPSASDATKARYSGVNGGSRGGGGVVKNGKVTMGKPFQKMAEALYPKLAKKNPALAHKKWAREVGVALDDGED